MSFVLTDKEVTTKKAGSDGKIEVQVASSSEKVDDHFKERICAIWPNLCLFLKQKLERAKPSDNGDGSLFELRFKDEKFTLLTQPWAADILGLKTELTFDTSHPEMIMPEIIALIKEPQIKH